MTEAETFTIEPPQKSGGSSKFIWIGLGCGLMLLLCCGVFGGGAVWVMSGFRPIEDPTLIAQMSGEMVKADIPPAYKPVLGMNMSLPFIGDIGRMVVYSTSEDRQNLQEPIFFMEIEAAKLGGQSPEQIADQMKSQVPSGQNQADLTETSTEKIETTVQGNPATFTLTTGKTEAGAERYLVNGTYQADGRVGIVMMDVDGKTLTRDEVVAFINSIE